jgi:hypothetical protein
VEFLNLPKFNIPGMKQKKLTAEAFQQIILSNLELMAESGQLETILRSPDRRPVNARFCVMDDSLHG